MLWHRIFQFYYFPFFFPHFIFFAVTVVVAGKSLHNIGNLLLAFPYISATTKMELHFLAEHFTFMNRCFSAITKIPKLLYISFNATKGWLPVMGILLTIDNFCKLELIKGVKCE